MRRGFGAGLGAVTVAASTSATDGGGDGAPEPESELSDVGASLDAGALAGCGGEPALREHQEEITAGGLGTAFIAAFVAALGEALFQAAFLADGLEQEARFTDGRSFGDTVGVHGSLT